MDNNKLQLIKDKLSQPGYINVQNRMEIANLLNDLDPEVANDIIKQFPEVKNLAIKAIDEIKDAYNKILASNEKSYMEYYKHSNEALDTFKNAYQNPNASIEEKKLAAENMQRILERDDEKDDKIADNNNKVLKIVAGSALLALCITVVALGGKFSIKPIDFKA